MYIDDLRLEIGICAFCPLMCKDICCFHGSAKNEDSAPHIRNLFLWKVLESKNDSQKKDALKKASEVIYQCTLCGQCMSWCGRSREIPINMMAGRADILDNGLAPDGVLKINKSSIDEHNPYGEKHNKRMEKISTAVKGKINKNARTGLWLGCTTLYYQPEIAEALCDIMGKAGLDYQILGDDEWCCGLPQYKLGLRETAADIAQHNVNALKKKGIETLIVDCPECYRAIKEFYPAMGNRFEGDIIHSTEFIKSLIEQEKIVLERPVESIITYHDPCELARHSTPEIRTKYKASDITEAPREILKKIPGIELKEMRMAREKTLCCGGSAGISEIYPEISLEIGKRVPGEALKTGADALVVACPSCKKQFSRDIGKFIKGLELFSIAEIVNRSLV